MALTVREVMNRELFWLRPGESVAEAESYLSLLGISGAPVIEGGKPVGVVSLRDLDGRKTGDTVRERMTSPCVTVHASARIDEAGRIAAERGIHRVVVVDDDGHAVGIASTLDLLRGLLGLPAVHPSTFPHLDLHTGLTWTDDLPLDLDHLEHAPQKPGVFVLVRSEPGLPDRVVWAEQSDNVRDRLARLLGYSPEEPLALLRVLEHPRSVRFRAAATSPTRDRARLLRTLMHDALHAHT